MYTGNPEVPDDVFADVLKQITHFVRSRVVPREIEIMATDAIPDDLRAQAAEMGLFGYAIPQEWGGLGLDLVQDVEVAMALGYTSLSFARCSAPTTASPGRCWSASAPTSRRRGGCPESPRVRSSPRSRSPSRVPVRTPRD